MPPQQQPRQQQQHQRHQHQQRNDYDKNAANEVGHTAHHNYYENEMSDQSGTCRSKSPNKISNQQSVRPTQHQHHQHYQDNVNYDFKMAQRGAQVMDAAQTFTDSIITPHKPKIMHMANEDEPNDILVCDTRNCQIDIELPKINKRIQRHYQAVSDEDNDRNSGNFYPNSLKRVKSGSTLRRNNGWTAGSHVDLSGSEVTLNGNASEASSDQFEMVAKQLEMIKNTQDSILAELSDDMSRLQYENVQIKNNNEHLTLQNTHLLDVIRDLTREVEQMREVFRVRGWTQPDIGLTEGSLDRNGKPVKGSPSDLVKASRKVRGKATKDKHNSSMRQSDPELLLEDKNALEKQGTSTEKVSGSLAASIKSGNYNNSSAITKKRSGSMPSTENEYFPNDYQSPSCFSKLLCRKNKKNSRRSRKMTRNVVMTKTFDDEDEVIHIL